MKGNDEEENIRKMIDMYERRGGKKVHKENKETYINKNVVGWGFT